MSKNSVIELNNERKLLKKWNFLKICFKLNFKAKSYDAFLASESLIKQIPRLLGPGLNKAGKFPLLLTHQESMLQKVDEVKATIKFQMKKVRTYTQCVIICNCYIGARCVISYQINSFVGFVSLCCCWSCGNDCGRTCTKCSPGHQFLGLTVEKALAKRAFIARQVFNGSFPTPLLKRVRFSTAHISFDNIYVA